MKGMGGILLGAAVLMTCWSQSAHTQQAQAAPALTFDGRVALWTVAIKPDKTGDFETIMAKLQQGLRQSSKPERRAQAEGWKVLKISKAMPDGNIAYVHVIDPVVPGADYTIMQTLYDEFPDERQTLYELYRNAFAKSLSMATGEFVTGAKPSAEVSGQE